MRCPRLGLCKGDMYSSLWKCKKATVFQRVQMGHGGNVTHWPLKLKLWYYHGMHDVCKMPVIPKGSWNFHTVRTFLWYMILKISEITVKYVYISIPKTKEVKKQNSALHRGGSLKQISGYSISFSQILSN